MPEPVEIYGSKTLYREVGMYQTRQQQYDRSLRMFDQAVNNTPEDRRTLVGRSWARSKAVQYPGAMADINKALQLYPEDLKIMQQKALLTFLNLDFEDSLVQNYRGLPKRKRPRWFIYGLMQCTEAIENCIGPRAGHPLRDHYDIIRKIAIKKAIESYRGFQAKQHKRKRKHATQDYVSLMYAKSIKALQKLNNETVVLAQENTILESLTDARVNEYVMWKPKAKSPYQPLQARTKNITNMMAEKYLEKMCLDKTFLKMLKDDPRLECPNYPHTVQIRKLAANGFKTVSFREEVLRTRRPFYSVKFQEGQMTANVRLRQQRELEKVQKIARDDVENMMTQLEQARLKKETNVCIDIAEHLKTYIDKKSLKIMPKKEDYQKRLYDMVAQVHYDKYRINGSMSETDKNKRVEYLFGILQSREPSHDSVIKATKKVFSDYKQAIELAEKRVQQATSPLEAVWLYHELARYNIDLKKWDLGRFFARKCINLSNIMGTYMWSVNASLLMARAHIQQHNRNETKNELKRTKEYAENLADKNILDFIDRCLNVVETKDFDEVQGSKVIKQREALILKALIHTENKKDIAVLFQQMSGVASDRRMSVMPGVRVEETVGKKKSKGTIRRVAAEDIIMNINKEADFFY